MRYQGKLYRPPSEAHSYILQATIGCSWNKCTYCDMYRDKEFRVRELNETLADLELLAAGNSEQIETIFVADGDALVLAMDDWRQILGRCRELMPRLRRISCYATAENVLQKTPAELLELRELGLTQLYIGPESGDEVVLKRIAKGSTYAAHVEAAAKAKAAAMRLSVIFLLGAGGIDRSTEHAAASARLATDMDPEFLAALTLTVIPGTPIAKLSDSGRFEVPGTMELLSELRSFVDGCRPSRAVFRTNHASNYLPIGGTLPEDREAILELIDRALAGEVKLRPERFRGL